MFGLYASGEVQSWGRQKPSIQSYINVKDEPFVEVGKQKMDAALIESAMGIVGYLCIVIDC